MVDTSSFDEEIRAQEALIADARQRLEVIYAEFREATVAWARACYQKDGRTLITTRPDDLRALEPKRLTQLKKNLDRLATDAESIVDDELQDVKWGHQPGHEPATSGSGYQSNPFRSSRGIPNVLDDALRRIRGRAGPLLMDVGLAQDGWSTYRYPFALTTPAEMNDAMRSYGETYDELLAADQARRKAEHERSTAEAADLWDKA